MQTEFGYVINWQYICGYFFLLNTHFTQEENSQFSLFMFVDNWANSTRFHYCNITIALRIWFQKPAIPSLFKDFMKYSTHLLLDIKINNCFPYLWKRYFGCFFFLEFS